MNDYLRVHTARVNRSDSPTPHLIAEAPIHTTYTPLPSSSTVPEMLLRSQLEPVLGSGLVQFPGEDPNLHTLVTEVPDSQPDDSWDMSQSAYPTPLFEDNHESRSVDLSDVNMNLDLLVTEVPDSQPNDSWDISPSASSDLPTIETGFIGPIERHVWRDQIMERHTRKEDKRKMKAERRKEKDRSRQRQQQRNAPRKLAARLRQRTTRLAFKEAQDLKLASPPVLSTASASPTSIPIRFIKSRRVVKTSLKDLLWDATSIFRDGLTFSQYVSTIASQITQDLYEGSRLLNGFILHELTHGELVPKINDRLINQALQLLRGTSTMTESDRLQQFYQDEFRPRYQMHKDATLVRTPSQCIVSARKTYLVNCLNHIKKTYYRLAVGFVKDQLYLSNIPGGATEGLPPSSYRNVSKYIVDQAFMGKEGLIATDGGALDELDRQVIEERTPLVGSPDLSGALLTTIEILCAFVRQIER